MSSLFSTCWATITASWTNSPVYLGPPELYERVKRNARREYRSFNSYVENVLDKATELEFPKIPDDYALSVPATVCR